MLTRDTLHCGVVAVTQMCPADIFTGLAPAQLPVLDHCFILSSYSGISQHFVSILEPTKQRQYLVIPQLAPASGRRDHVELDFVKISSCLVKVLCSKADSKPTSCLNSKVYEVDVYKCLVG